MDEDLSELPRNLPIPKDDGKGNHLEGMVISRKILQQITGGSIGRELENKKTIILCFFPRISISGKRLPSGWNEIPGARGCTPQNIALSKYFKSFEKHSSLVIGISTQSKEELRKIALERKFLHLLVSDTGLQFKKKFEIPVFKVEDKAMYKRITLIVRESRIVKVFYPIFPPDSHAVELLEWLNDNLVIT